MTKILVATDGSPNGDRAVDTAAQLSAKLGGSLDVVHVLMHGRPPEELQRMAEVEYLVTAAGAPAMPPLRSMDPVWRSAGAPPPDQMPGREAIADIGEHIVQSAKERAKRAGAGEVREHVLVGDVADGILDTAADLGAEMIVMGSRGLGRVRGVLLGSVSQKVLHHAACSVVVVR